MANMDHNLFKYATSELSQDAFICWLLSFAMEDDGDSQELLRDCALDLLARMCVRNRGGRIEPKCVLKIEQQFCLQDEPTYLQDGRRQKPRKWYIDVLIYFRAQDEDTYYLIVEDKTYTSEHDDQLKAYRRILSRVLNTDVSHILGAYYKSSLQGDLSAVEYADYAILLRPDILNVFQPHYRRMRESKVKSEIFLSYFEKLADEEAVAELYGTTSPTEWDFPQIEKFCDHMKKEFDERGGDCLSWNYYNQKGDVLALCGVDRRIKSPDARADCSVYMQCDFTSVKGEDGKPHSFGSFCIKLCVKQAEKQEELPKVDRNKIADELVDEIVTRDQCTYKQRMSRFGFERPSRIQAASYTTIVRPIPLYGTELECRDANTLIGRILYEYEKYEEFCKYLRDELHLLDAGDTP